MEITEPYAKTSVRGTEVGFGLKSGRLTNLTNSPGYGKILLCLTNLTNGFMVRQSAGTGGERWPRIQFHRRKAGQLRLCR